MLLSEAFLASLQTSPPRILLTEYTQVNSIFMFLFYLSLSLSLPSVPALSRLVRERYSVGLIHKGCVGIKLLPEHSTLITHEADLFSKSPDTSRQQVSDSS